MSYQIDPGIYSIRNIENGKVYIGSSARIRKRKDEHFARLRAGKHFNGILQKSWNKYGETAFVFEVLERVEDVNNLIEREQFWIDEMRTAKRNVGYNLCPIAGRPTGLKRTPETCARISAAKKGVKRSPETRARISAGLLGHETSPECREKRRINGLGRKHSPEALAKIIAAKTGKSPSPETRAKLSAATKGRPRPRELVEQTAAAHRGMKRTPETCRRISEALLSSPKQAAASAARIGTHHSEETRRKLSIAAKNRTTKAAVGHTP